MTDNKDWFVRKPKNGMTMEMLLNYKPKTTEELAEWILIASRNLVDQEGKLIFNPLRPFMGYQLARMMQIANLKIPNEDGDTMQETAQDALEEKK